MSREKAPATIVKLAEHRDNSRRNLFESFVTENLSRELFRRGTVLKICPTELLTAMNMPAGSNISGYTDIISRKYYSEDNKEHQRFKEKASAGWIRVNNGLILPDIVALTDPDGESSIDFYPKSNLQGFYYDNSFNIKRKNKRGLVDAHYDANGELQKIDIVIGKEGISRTEEEGVIIFDCRPNYSIRRMQQNNEGLVNSNIFLADAKSVNELIFTHSFSDDNLIQITGTLLDTGMDVILVPTKLNRDSLIQQLFTAELLGDPLNASPSLDATWKNNIDNLTRISWNMRNEAKA